MAFSHQSKTTTTQQQDKCLTCAFLWSLSHQVRQTWCERYHMNAQVQHLSCRCLALVWKHHKTCYILYQQPQTIHQTYSFNQDHNNRPKTAMFSPARPEHNVHITPSQTTGPRLSYGTNTWACVCTCRNVGILVATGKSKSGPHTAAPGPGNQALPGSQGRN